MSPLRGFFVKCTLIYNNFTPSGLKTLNRSEPVKAFCKTMETVKTVNKMSPGRFFHGINPMVNEITTIVQQTRQLTDAEKGKEINGLSNSMLLHFSDADFRRLSMFHAENTKSSFVGNARKDRPLANGLKKSESATACVSETKILFYHSIIPIFQPSSLALFPFSCYSLVIELNCMLTFYVYLM